MNPSDSELVMLTLENNEEAERLLYQRYFIYFNYVLKKYKFIIKALNINYQDIYNECLQSFDIAIKSFDLSKDVAFSTYVQVVIERNVKKNIKKASRHKNKIIIDSLSFDAQDFNNFFSIENMIKDSKFVDPLIDLTFQENIEELENVFKKELSEFEYSVLKLLLNEYNYHQIAEILHKSSKQVDNAIQRIKSKLKDKVLKMLEI